MGAMCRLRLGAAALFVAFGAGAPVAATMPVSAPFAADDCPSGEAADDADRWQCVHECSAGMLYDGESDTCVAPPGVPPPALSPQIPQAPQIPQM